MPNIARLLTKAVPQFEAALCFAGAAYLIYLDADAFTYLAVVAAASLFGMVYVRQATIARLLASGLTWQFVRLGCFAIVTAGAVVVLHRSVDQVLDYSTIYERRNLVWYPKSFPEPNLYPRRWIVVRRSALILDDRILGSEFSLNDGLKEKAERSVRALSENYVAIPVSDSESATLTEKQAGPVDSEIQIVWDSLSTNKHGWAFRLMRLLVFPFIITTLLGAAIGLIFFFSMRLFLFVAAMSSNPLATLRMLPRVWFSRQFRHGIFSRLELLPGYRLTAEDAAGFIPRSNGEFYRAILRNGAHASIVFAAILSRLLFKLSLPFLILLVYLTEPIGGDVRKLGETARASQQSRFSIPILGISITILLLFFVKVVIYWNAPEVEHWLSTLRLRPLSKILEPYTITLWQITSLASACLYMVLTRLEDNIASSTGLNEQGGTDPWLRALDVMRRLRWLFALYSIVCILIISHPLLRHTLHQVANIEVFKVPLKTPR